MTEHIAIWGLVIFFIASGLVVGAINTLFEETSEDFSTDSIQQDVREQSYKPATSTNIFKILLSVVSMSFWTFGALPLWVELIIYLPLRVMFWYLIAKAVIP